MSAQQEKCALCGHTIGGFSVGSGSNSFCCFGCQTVYRILLVRRELDDFQTHPLFVQALKSGLISNPHLLEEIRSKQAEALEEGVEKVHFEITDLWCPSCADVIRLMLMQQKGIKNCLVDYATDLASVEYSPRHLSRDQVLDQVKRLGYTPKLLETSEPRAVQFSLYLRFIIAAFFSANIMMLSYPMYASYFTEDPSRAGVLFAWISLVAALPVLLYSAKPIFQRFFNGLLLGFFGMEALIVLGVSSAFGLSVYTLCRGGEHVYFDSMSVIITFVLLGKIFESRAKFSTKATLFRLSKSIPKKGRKHFIDGTEQFVALKEVAKGDLLVVLAGEKIVLDGVVVEGEGTSDESMMTGEPIPLTKRPGDRVTGGTILCEGRLLYRVVSEQDATLLHQIVQMIENDIDRKSYYTRAVDPIVRWFVPAIFLIAFLTASVMFLMGRTGEEVILRAVSILLISCPCAIGIAAPLAESRTLSALAGLGAMVRNRACLAVLGKEDFWLFDKTGTVTEGHFEVLSGIDGLSPEDQRVLKALVSHSAHPICVAIGRHLVVDPAPLQHCREWMGKGLQAQAQESEYLFGSFAYLAEQGAEGVEPASAWKGIATEVFFLKDKQLIARIILGDKIKPDVAAVVQALKPASAILLSGDAAISVERVARACHFDDWRALMSPLDKRNFIDELRAEGKVVCMMGDGMNDAPALTGANVGISVLSATDLSIQVSDILLTTERLSVLPKMRAAAIKGRRILKQNLFWAFFYNGLGIGLAVAGVINPLISAVAMVLSSLVVVLNAQRISIEDSR